MERVIYLRVVLIYEGTWILILEGVKNILVLW